MQHHLDPLYKMNAQAEINFNNRLIKKYPQVEKLLEAKIINLNDFKENISICGIFFTSTWLREFKSELQIIFSDNGIVVLSSKYVTFKLLLHLDSSSLDNLLNTANGRQVLAAGLLTEDEYHLCKRNSHNKTSILFSKRGLENLIAIYQTGKLFYNSN